jgi:hypothetical protein
MAFHQTSAMSDSLKAESEAGVASKKLSRCFRLWKHVAEAQVLVIVIGLDKAHVRYRDLGIVVIAVGQLELEIKRKAVGAMPGLAAANDPWGNPMGLGETLFIQATVLAKAA